MDEKEFGLYVSKWINHNREILKKYDGEYVGLVFLNGNIEVVSHGINSSFVTKQH